MSCPPREVESPRGACAESGSPEFCVHAWSPMIIPIFGGFCALFCLIARRCGPRAALLGAAVLAGCSSTTGGASSSAVAPTVLAETPADGAVNVARNSAVSATFSVPMDPATLTAANFVLTTGGAAVAGTLTPGADGLTATVRPAVALPADATVTAAVTTAVRSAAGVPLAADFTWHFTTGVSSDATAPVVTGTLPLSQAMNVPTNAPIAVTFSEPMDPTSLTGGALFVKQGEVVLAGTVTYGDGATTAGFVPTVALPADATITATVSTGAKDLAGNPLAAAYVWSFTTGATVAKGPAIVQLGTAGDFAILAKTGVSTVPASAITGNVGVSPAAATYLTGFSLVADATNVFSTSPQVTGKLFAANYAAPTPMTLTTAIANMAAAYTDAAGRPMPDFLELGTGALGGLTLAPGLYKWTSTVTIATDLTLAGGPDDVWILQTSGGLHESAAQHVILSGGAQAKHVFWQVAGSVTLGANAHFEGNLLCQTDVTLQTGASVNGRILAQTQVALQQATVTQPAP